MPRASACAGSSVTEGFHPQNNVLELWSLFDFLMPGFLGTERQFAARYGKPILASRDAKSSSREQEAGVLAMEALHRQVLPFLLRRMKEDVLQDLPPKIIQDYYCNLSPLQVLLLHHFSYRCTDIKLHPVEVLPNLEVIFMNLTGIHISICVSFCSNFERISVFALS